MQLESSIQPTHPLVPHAEEERGMLAPKDGLTPRQVKPQQKGYDELLKEICKRIDSECDERAETRARRYTRNHNYWWGGERRFQYWKDGKWNAMDKSKVKKLFSNNQFFYQVRTILSTVTRSHPKLSVSPSPSVKDSAEKVSAAGVGLRSLQHDQREKLNAEFMVREWMDKLLCGIAIRGQWYSKEGSQAKARVPTFEQREIQLPGMYLCANCGMTGPDSYASKDLTGQVSCPHCNSQADIFPGETVSVPVHSGYEEIQDGDCLTYGISPYEFDLAPEARGLADSPYARWQRRVRKSKIKRAYKNIDTDKLESSTLPVMLQAQEATKRGKTESKKDFTVLKTYWISVDEYYEFSSTKPLTCLGGMEVPAGTVISDEYPQGLRVDICGEQIIDIRGEVKEDCLSVSTFHLDPMSWEGKGLDDAAELQRWIDDIHTLYVQIQLREALGITLFDNEMFSNGKFTGEVGMIAGVDVPQDGSGKTIKDAMINVSGNQPNQSIFAGMEYVQNSQIKVAGGFDAISGAGQEGSETARGRIIQREMGLQGLGVPLFLAARHDMIWAKQNLKLKKQNWVSERYVPYLKDGEPLGGKWFSASAIDTDFIIDIEADSWMPLTRMDEIDNLTTAVGGEQGLEAVGGFAGILANPQLKSLHPLARRGLELLNVPKGTDPEEKDVRNARHRYGILKQAVEKVVEQGDPSIPQDAGQDAEMDDESSNVPPEMNTPLLVSPEQAMPFATLPSVRPLPGIDNDAVFIQFYTDCIKDAVDSDGIENHPITKAALMLLVQAHKQNGVASTQADQMLQIQANAPQMMMQQQQEAQQSDAQARQENDKVNLSHQQGIEKQVIGSKLKQEENKAKLKPNKAKSLLDEVKIK